MWYVKPAGSGAIIQAVLSSPALCNEMKYAILFAIMSAVLAWGGVLHPRIAWLFIWSAISFGMVALGYAGVGVRVFGKRPDGRIAWWGKLLNLPYLLYAWLVWHLYRLMSREAPYNQVDVDLVVGRRLLPSEVPDQFDHYIDLTSEFEEPASLRSRVGYRCYPILDASVPSASELQRATSTVKSGKAFIHCAQGHGRTGLFAVALLVRRGRVKTAEEGIQLLKRMRPAISLNKAQTLFLERYMKEFA